MTLEASNGGDDRGRAQRPASHRSKRGLDDAGRAVVTRSYGPRCDDFYASFGVAHTERENEY
jgi:hypothetical protein